jgi:Ser/Thr protein kinase RdoA (MazF antagonist)
MPSLSQDEATTLARNALALWDMADVPFSLKGHAQSWVFQVTQADGLPAMLRLIPTEAQSAVPLQIRFLLTLARETSLLVPRPLRSERFIVRDSLWEAVFFAYVPGENRAPSDLTEEDASRVGGFLASLHFEAQRHMRPQTADARLNADGLLGPTSVYASPNESQFLTLEDEAWLRSLYQRVTDTETLIGPSPQHILLLHGDFLLQNIVFDGETVGALDFEMCGWGLDLYDLATFLWQMKPLPNYERIADAFWHGYTQWRDLPPREWLEVFIAARHGASVRWVIQNRHLPGYAERVNEIVRQRMDEIAGFLDTGVLKRN